MRTPQLASRLLVLALLLCCVLAGCAASGDTADDNGSRHGFYTGVSGGMFGP